MRILASLLCSSTSGETTGLVVTSWSFPDMQHLEGFPLPGPSQDFIASERETTLSFAENGVCLMQNEAEESVK